MKLSNFPADCALILSGIALFLTANAALSGKLSITVPVNGIPKDESDQLPDTRVYSFFPFLDLT
jgi:hypothetical protein